MSVQAAIDFLPFARGQGRPFQGRVLQIGVSSFRNTKPGACGGGAAHCFDDPGQLEVGLELVRTVPENLLGGNRHHGRKPRPSSTVLRLAKRRRWPWYAGSLATWWAGCCRIVPQPRRIELCSSLDLAAAEKREENRELGCRGRSAPRGKGRKGPCSSFHRTGHHPVVEDFSAGGDRRFCGRNYKALGRTGREGRISGK